MKPKLSIIRLAVFLLKLVLSSFLLFFTLNIFAQKNTDTNSKIKTIYLSQIRDTIYPSIQRFNRIDGKEHENTVKRHFNDIVLTQKSIKGKEVSSVVSGNITLNMESTGTTCGYSNGNITVSASNGTPPYMFSINGEPFQSSGLFQYLSAGRYDIQVKDANGIRTSTKVTLDNTYDSPSGKVVSITNPSGCSATDGKTILSASGGLSPYTYSIDLINFQSNNIFKNLAANWYTYYYVKDANGCLSDIPGYSIYNCDIRFDWSYTYAFCGGSGSVHVQDVWGGTAPYTFSLDGVSFQSSGELTGIPRGINNLYIKDATGTTLIYSFQVYESCGFYIVLNKENATCGNNDGQITINSVGGTSPFLYSIDGTNFQSDNSFSNLVPGSYKITAKDATGELTQSETTVISSGCLSISAKVKSTTCDYNNGAIKVAAENGTEPYTYSLDGINFQESSAFTFLEKGTYTVVVKDATGLTKDTTVKVGNDAGPTETFSITASTCQAGGSIIITAHGGTPPLQYSIDKINYQTSNVFTNVYRGPYTPTVRDSNGCQFFQCCYWIPDKCIQITTQNTNATCNQNNGSIVVTATNGKPPYSYSIDGTNFQSSNSFINLRGGNYTITVKDANDNSNTTNVTINNVCISISNTIIDETCGNKNGSIAVTASNGASPYSYSIDGINFQSSSTFAQLTAGDYTITVRDVNGSITSISATLLNISGPQLKASSTAATCADHDGSITAEVTGGTAPFQYSVDGISYQGTGIFSTVDKGAYIVTAKDVNGCLSSESVDVALIYTLTLDAGNDIVLCEGTNTTLNASSNGLSFSWSPSNGLNNTTILNPLASPSTTTKYYLTASTSICVAIDSVTVFVNPAPQAYAGVDSAICFGKDYQLNGSDGVSYTWQPSTYLSNSNIQNPVVVKPVHSISYNLSVIDQNGCKSLQDDIVTITVTPNTKVFAGNDTMIAFNQPLQFNATDVNNCGFTQYVWSPSTGLDNAYVKSPIAILNHDMMYTVTAIAPGGCEGIDTINVKAFQGPDIYVPSAFTPNGDGKNDVLRAIPVGIKEFKSFAVYSRWGQRIFFTTNPQKGWNGKLSGIQQANANTFIWIALGVDYNGNKIERKGSVVLIQ